MASLQGVASMGMMRHAAKMTPRAGLRASPPAAIRILCPWTKPLEAVREELIAAIVGAMPEAHRQFLLSFKLGNPDWALLDIPGARELPAVQWRQKTIDGLSSVNRARLIRNLEGVLFAGRARGAF